MPEPVPRHEPRDPSVRVGLVVPTYPPKFGHTRNLLLSMKLCGQTRSSFHVFLVFSTDADGEQFRRSTARSPLRSVWQAAVSPLTIDPGTHRAEAYKKLLGVKHVFGLGFDYALTLDCDVWSAQPRR